MVKSNPDINIYEFLDYRKFLEEFFRAKKEINPNFSNRTFCTAAGLPLNNTSLVSKIIMGKRNLTQSLRFKFSQALNLKNEQKQYFDILVQFNQAKGMSEKNHLFGKLKEFRESKAKLLKQDQYRIHKKWYYSIVRAYFGLYPDNRNFKDLVKFVFPAITQEEVEEAAKTLQDIGLLVRTANGYRVTEPHISTDREIDDLMGKNQIKEMTNLSMLVFDHVPAKLREYNSMTMYMSEDCYQTIKNRIHSFREELRVLLDNDKNEDRIYTLTMQLFPNGQLPGETLKMD